VSPSRLSLTVRSSWLDSFRIPVIFYDQIGNGESSHCSGVPKQFWTPELFMDELDNLLHALEIYEDFDLLGQSWGGK